MSRVFVGRPVLPGAVRGAAAVSRGGFNTYASFFASVHGPGPAVCADRGNPDLLGLDLAGTVLCLPRTTGSTSGGAVWQRLVALGNAPAAVLFALPIDPLAAGGLVLADEWGGGRIVTVDGLGDEFLAHVRTGDLVMVGEDGLVTVERPSTAAAEGLVTFERPRPAAPEGPTTRRPPAGEEEP